MAKYPTEPTLIESQGETPDGPSGSGGASGPHQARVEQGLLGARNPRDLKGRSVRGGAVTMLGQALSFALQLGSTVVLARLLTPSDYGLQGMVYSLTGFFSLFKDAGLSAATVQKETLTHEQASTLFWINTGVGALLAVLVAASGPVLAVFYKEPRLRWVTVASATVFLLHGIAIQHRALLNRAMRFAAITGIDLSSAIVGTAVGIYMAARGFGYWSLVGISISSSIVSTTTYFFVMPWMPGRPVRGSGIRSILRFGSTVTLNSFVVYLAYNTEKILLGRFWGVEPLGIYSRAYSLANLPVQQFIGAVGAVAFPLLSRVQNDSERLRRTFMKCHALVVSLIVPAVIVCSLFADEIIKILLGPKWNGVAPVVRLLTPAVLIFALINPLAWLLKSTGRVRRSLNIAFLIAPVVILGVVVGLPYGPTGVAMGYSVAMLVLMAPSVAWSKHGTGITTRDYFDTIKHPLIAGAAGAVAGWAFKAGFQSSLVALPLLVLGVTLALAVYAGVLLVVLKQGHIYRDLVRQLMPRIRTAPAED